MKVLKTIDLGGGKFLEVRQHHVGRTFHTGGAGNYATFTLKEAQALYGAMRTLDSEGLLEGEE